MNWALSSLGIVVLALLLSLWWYERTRPSARTVALVGTLAALAAIGRLAFAPIPNVTPTTDIIVLAGVALGAAPGFAVGAVAALSSNVVFGQGPWTPWQMLAWGVCGLLGAGLGVVFRQRLGRWRLAAGCLVAGLLFGLIMNVSTWLAFTAGGSGGTLLAVSASAAPFDAAHAIGNVVFALAFGPALLLALRRSQARREGRFVAVDELPPRERLPARDERAGGGERMVGGERAGGERQALLVASGASAARESALSSEALAQARER